MPLRYVRKKLTAENALSVAVATSELSREISDLLQFAPARAATGILFLIFKTIQDIQKNKTECYRLARRCLTVLTDVRDAMDGRWDNAPDTLLKNLAKFERILQAIHDDLRREAEGSWRDRLLRKNSIEIALSEYHTQIDDAVRSFQMVTLIHLHHTIGDGGLNHKDRRSGPLATTSLRDTDSISSPAPSYSSHPVRRSTSTSSVVLCESPATTSTFSISDPLQSATGSSLRGSTDSFEILESPRFLQEDSSQHDQNTREALDEAKLLAEMAQLDHHGFTQYHISDISHHTARRSRISSGWWAGAREVNVNDRNALMLNYDQHQGEKRAAAVKRWLKDVRTLQVIHHPNLPQMIGYSGTDAPTPFILLADVQTLLPQARLLAALDEASLLDCIKLLITFCKDTFDAATYLARQLSLSESKTQDYVEHASYRISVSKTGKQSVVMGLPPPEANIDRLESWRNFGLAWSVAEVWLKVLPNRGIAYKLVDRYDDLSFERQMKLNHLTLLAKALLPSNDAPDVAGKYLDEVTREISLPSDPYGSEDEDEEAILRKWKMGSTKMSYPVTLNRLRLHAIRQSRHAHMWSNNFVPAFLFNVGDVGYISPSSAEDPQSEEGLPAYMGFHRFIRLHNILENEDDDANPEIEEEATGSTTSFDFGRLARSQLEGFEVGGGTFGWPIVTSPQQRISVQITHEERLTNINHAWDVLLRLAPRLASKHGVQPEELLLVTRAGTDQRFKITDIRSAPPSFHNRGPPIHQQHTFGFHQQHPQTHTGHHIHRSLFPEPPPQPTYLFTSSEKDVEARLSDSPVFIPPTTKRKKKEQPQSARCMWANDGVYGFMNYVQLHKEDFD